MVGPVGVISEKDWEVRDGGPGADEINAQDGQKDTTVIRSGQYDLVFYDKGLNVWKVSLLLRRAPN